MHFRYTPVPDWPPLAWLASGHRGDPTVEVFHGLDVETTPEGFSEAVWDGEFARAGFDETDLVFGSGARRRGGGVTFVSSGSTLDRLHSHEVAGRVCVANSLACPLVAIGADVDPTYAGYYADFKSISDGLARYARSVATSAGPVRLTYFHNLVWDGRALRERPKPAPRRDFGDFAAYRGFLEASLAGLAQNLSSSGRAVPLRMLGTISSGYDSPAVTVLAQPYGLQEAIAFEPSSSGAPDSGGAIAQALGVRLRRLARDAWRPPGGARRLPPPDRPTHRRNGGRPARRVRRPQADRVRPVLRAGRYVVPRLARRLWRMAARARRRLERTGSRGSDPLPQRRRPAACGAGAARPAATAQRPRARPWVPSLSTPLSVGRRAGEGTLPRHAVRGDRGTPSPSAGAARTCLSACW